MVSDALFESVERLDHYLADPGWRSDCEPATLARADAIRAAMDALRGMLDADPSTGDAIETAISGDIGPLETQIARLAEAGARTPRRTCAFARATSANGRSPRSRSSRR